MLREYELKNGGFCTNYCLIEYKELATKRAYAMFHLKKATKKAVVLGMLAMIHHVSECSRRSFNYCLDKSSHICNVAFCAITGFKIKSMQKKSFSESDVAPQMHVNSKAEIRAL